MDIKELTNRIESYLDKITLQTDNQDTINLVKGIRKSIKEINEIERLFFHQKPKKWGEK